MSVQQYETDALQEHVDSTPILIQRLDQWRDGVRVVQNFANGFYQLQQNTTAHLEKMLKGVSDFPSFPSSSVGEGGSSGPAGDSQLAAVFSQLQTEVNAILQKSTATQGNIKQTVLPALEQVDGEIEKHYKSLKSHGLKGIKEVEKAREQTQKEVENLGSVTSSFGARQLSSHEDPYVLHRRAEAAVAEQISRENNQAEAALQVQQQFASLEQHVVHTVKQSLAQLAALIDGYDSQQTRGTALVAQAFGAINMAREWDAFVQANKEQLVPSTNFLRSAQYVTFSNKNHPSTEPVVQGLLNRKGTVLKQYSQGYYVLTPAGYLYQFKSAEPTIDSTPELALFIPDSEVNKNVKGGDFTFRVVAKDALKTIAARHKYIFKANSQREWEIWYNAIAKMAGHIVPDADEPGSPDPESAGLNQQMGNLQMPSKQQEVPSHATVQPQQPVQQQPGVQPIATSVQPTAQPPAPGVQYTTGQTTVQQTTQTVQPASGATPVTRDYLPETHTVPQSNPQYVPQTAPAAHQGHSHTPSGYAPSEYHDAKGGDFFGNF